MFYGRPNINTRYRAGDTISLAAPAQPPRIAGGSWTLIGTVQSNVAGAKPVNTYRLDSLNLIRRIKDAVAGKQTVKQPSPLAVPPSGTDLTVPGHK